MAVILLSLYAVTAAPAQTGWSCSPRPDLAQALDAVEREAAAAPAPDFVWFDHLRRLQARFPGDFHLTLRQLRAAQSAGLTGALTRAETVPRYRQPGGSPVERLFSAWTWIGEQTPEAIRQLNALGQDEPALPWTDYTLAWIYMQPAFRNPEAAARHLTAFLEACPDALDGYELLPRIPLAQPQPAPLRAALSTLREVRALRLWPVLWAAEFRADGEAARARVAPDLARLEAWAPDGAALAQVRAAAARLTGTAGVQPRPPAPDPLAEWERAHPEPPFWAAEERRTWATQALAFTDQLDDSRRTPRALAERARYLALTGAPPRDILDAGERAIAALDAGPAAFAPWSWFSVVEAWLEPSGLWDRAAALIERLHNAPQVEYHASDLIPGSADTAAMLNRSARLGRASVLLYQAELAARRGRTGEAERHLADYAAAVDRERHPPLRDNAAPRYEARLYETRARIAMNGNQPRAAALWLRRALHTIPPPHPGASPAARRAKELWHRAGGTDEEWREMEEAAPARRILLEAAATEETFRRPFPAFELTGTDGRRWSLTALRGKPVLINLWATWCAPCVAELPELEKLHREFAATGEAVVLTFNLNDNPGVIAPFMEKHALTLPVVPAAAWVEANLDITGIPRTLILNAAGEWVSESRGFNPADTGWSERMRRRLRDARD